MKPSSQQTLETQKEWLRTRCRLERVELCAYLQEAKANGPFLGSSLLGSLLHRVGPGAGLLSTLPVLAWLLKTWLMRDSGGVPWWTKGLASWLLLRFKTPGLLACQLAKKCWNAHPRWLLGLAAVTALGAVVLTTWRRRN